MCVAIPCSCHHHLLLPLSLQLLHLLPVLLVPELCRYPHCLSSDVAEEKVDFTTLNQRLEEDKQYLEREKLRLENEMRRLEGETVRSMQQVRIA